MKVFMSNWVSPDKRLPAWFKDNEEAEITLEQLKELYDTGLNVMLYHNGDSNVLYVDHLRFSQR